MTLLDPASSGPYPKHAHSLECLSRASGLVVAAVGAAVMLGWIADIPELKSGLPGAVAMKVNTALSFVLIGAALWLLRSGSGGIRNGGWATTAGRLTAGVVALVGLLTLAEYAADIDLGIDQAIIPEPPGALLTVHLGRPSPITAFNFLIAGFVLLVLDSSVGRRGRLVEVLASFGGALSLLGLVGYVYGAAGFYKLLSNVTGIALNTAILFIVLFLGILLSRPQHAVCAVLSGDDAGGILARRLLPMAFCAPLLLEAVAQSGEWFGLWQASSSDALHAVLMILTFVAIALPTARLLKRMDAAQQLLQRALMGARDTLEQTVEQRTRALREENAAREAIEEALRQSQQELEKTVRQRTAELMVANEEVRNFAYIVSHDLRAPLVNIQGFCGELQRSLEDLRRELDSHAAVLPASALKVVDTILEEDAKEAMGFIGAATAKMDRLINAILRLSRLGRQTLTPEPIDLSVVMDTTLATLRHDIEHRGITVERRPLPTVLADRVAMEQVAGNLLSNAIKYLDPDRPGHIAIRADNTVEGTTIHIQDNGRGMAAEDIPKAFELFRRVGSQNTAGEGMGLPYVQTLVRRHRGRIECRSTPGEGTTFSVFLPWFGPRAEKQE